MAFALRNAPKLSFVQPDGVTMASWDTGYGTVTDAFKTGQEPGASGPLGGRAYSGSGGASGGSTGGGSTGGGVAAGVDTGLGGLY